MGRSALRACNVNGESFAPVNREVSRECTCEECNLVFSPISRIQKIWFGKSDYVGIDLCSALTMNFKPAIVLVISVAVLRQKTRNLLVGLWSASVFSARMFRARISGRKNLIFHCGANQLGHLEPLLRALAAHPAFQRVQIGFLTRFGEVELIETALASLGSRIHAYPQSAVRFLLFADFALSVEQGMLFPFLGCRIRACSYHGQPSKANVYSRFNYKQINHLFFYGPLMRDHYLDHRRHNPHWPEIEYHEVGQPLTDRLFTARPGKAEARGSLGLERERFTVLYAPSFEYCSSLSTSGPAIIETLLSLDINVIIKPHPAFYNDTAFEDGFNSDMPNAVGWRERILSWQEPGRIVFTLDNTLDMAAALFSADVMLTDYSGVAFDGILMDLGLIYWECPEFYLEYLPQRYGVDGVTARTSLACNAGLEAGLAVQTKEELVAAVAAYRQNPTLKGEDRERVRGQLLFNPGASARIMANKIMELVGVDE